VQGLDLRDGVRGLIGYADRDLAALWKQVSTAAEAQVALNDVLPALIRTYGAAAGVLAANWYDELRLKVGVAGAFTAIPADIPETGAYALVGWALEQANDLESLQSLIEGGMQRRIANFSRATITGSSVADPQATGWQRVGSGECTFCRMLIGRGAVYTEAGADFASHDHCHCSATPAFKDQPRPVKPYTPSTRSSTDADRARVRAYLRDH
jgi:hypothetical protein